HESEAVASRDAVTQKMSGLSDDDIAKRSLNSGLTAYRRGEYANAKTYFDLVLGRTAQDWPQRPQAQDYSRKSANRIQQQQHLNQAQSYFIAKNFEAAKNEANQVISTPDGDAGFVKQATDLLSRISNPSSNAPAKPQPAPTGEPPSPAVQSLSREATG